MRGKTSNFAATDLASVTVVGIDKAGINCKGNASALTDLMTGHIRMSRMRKLIKDADVRRQ